jgi:hypothetical protein
VERNHREEDPPWTECLPDEPHGAGQPDRGALAVVFGTTEDLSWFRHAWEDHVKRYHFNLPEKTLMELMHRYCITVNTGKIIEGARNLVELWLLLETHFD